MRNLFVILTATTFFQGMVTANPGLCPFYPRVSSRDPTCYKTSDCSRDSHCKDTQKCCENPCGITLCFDIDPAPPVKIEKCPTVHLSLGCTRKHTKFCFIKKCNKCCNHESECNPAPKLLKKAEECNSDPSPSTRSASSASSSVGSGLVSISGNWRNGLGSTMTVDEMDDGSIHLKGAYCTNVSRTNLPVPGYPLHGTIGRGEAPTSIGFAVTFEDANGNSSTTAWSGQYREDDKGSVIYTTWVLTKPPVNANEMWASTNIGQDVFRRSTDGFVCSTNMPAKKKKEDKAKCGATN